MIHNKNPDFRKYGVRAEIPFCGVAGYFNQQRSDDKKNLFLKFIDNVVKIDAKQSRANQSLILLISYSCETQDSGITIYSPMFTTGLQRFIPAGMNAIPGIFRSIAPGWKVWQ